MSKILVIGAGGQIGTELVNSLRKKHGNNEIIAADIKPEPTTEIKNGPYQVMDILQRDQVRSFIIDNQISEVYLLAALLSATAEKMPDFAWKLNMESLFTILDLAKEGYLSKVFWPSSIAAFGPTTPQENTPQTTVMEPSTVYGISKLAGERWCEYYHQKYGVDVRSIRYPGLISYTALPGGGTTDYAVDIFYQALLKQEYTCFLEPHTELPMMYMEDAIRATIELMEAPKNQVKIRSSYNIAGCSFSPEELAQEIQKTIPEFQIHYEADFRQKIAETWPKSIDDQQAKEDWGWKSRFSIEELVQEMLNHVDVSKM